MALESQTPLAGRDLAFADELHRRLQRLIGVYETCDRTCALSDGVVTVAQGYALLALPAEGSMNMRELSTAMGLAGSTMTRVVDQLVLKQLAVRAPSDEDRRVVLVSLTDRGRAVRAGVGRRIDEIFASVTASVPDEERQPLLRAIDVISTAMTDAASRCCSA